MYQTRNGNETCPKSVSLKLRKFTRKIGLTSTNYKQEFEIKKDLLTAKNVDGINMTGAETKSTTLPLKSRRSLENANSESTTMH